MSNESKCPFAGHARRPEQRPVRSRTGTGGRSTNLSILHQHGAQSNPLGADFDYAEAFRKLDLAAVKRDLYALMTDSRTGGPPTGATTAACSSHGLAQRGHLSGCGRTGWRRPRQPALPPVNSWPDNGNLDKARRLLWPIKQKYGNRISWADLMILAGNCALESMGFRPSLRRRTRGHLGTGKDIYWGQRIRVAGRPALPRRPRTGETPSRRCRWA